jgi:hypothetical protein
MILDYDKFKLEKKEVANKNLNSSINEGEKTLQEFAKNRLKGASKISKEAKEKGGDALLTYHHFHVKLPYYQKSADGELNIGGLKEEYDNLLTDLYEATRNSMNISQVKFQELVGKIEVVGELLIENK